MRLTTVDYKLEAIKLEAVDPSNWNWNWNWKETAIAFPNNNNTNRIEINLRMHRMLAESFIPKSIDEIHYTKEQWMIHYIAAVTLAL